MLTFFFFLLIVLLELLRTSFFYPLPISDTENVRHRTIPWVTFGLIFVNGIIFIGFQAANLYQGSQLIEENAFDPDGWNMIYSYITQIWTFGYRDALLREPTAGIGAFTTFTSMFMHADMWHLLGNMLYLWTFGRRLEDACGAWRFLTYYLAAGMIANIGSAVLTPAQGDIPGVGASGAIAGVMGAYLILFPGSLVLCFWGIGLILRLPVVAVLKLAGVKAVADARMWRWTIRLPAWTLLIAFLVMNTLPSLEVIQQGANYGGVDTLAHLTGFLAALLIFLFVRKDVLSRYVSGRSL